MGSKGGGSQTTVQKADPWEGVQPYLRGLYGEANNWFQSGGGSGVFPGQVAASQPWDLSHSINMTRDMATRGVGTEGLGQARWTTEDIANSNYLSRNPIATGQMTSQNAFANGDMMRENPYLRDMVSAATRSTQEDFMNSIAPSLASQFSAAGRTGSGAHIGAFSGAAGKLAERLGDVSSNMYGRAYESDMGRRFAAYENERGAQRQMFLQDPQTRLQASALLPAIGQARYLDADRLMRTGAMSQDLEQDRIDREMARWTEARDLPMQRMQALSALLQGASAYGMQSSSTQMPKTSRAGGALSGAMGGAMMGSVIPGIGTMAGAVVGGLSGLFG